MGYQVIRQPGTDMFGVFCSYTETFVMWEATRSDVVDFFVEIETKRAREDAERIVGLVEAGNEREAYFQFAMTWDEAVALDREHGGELSAELDAASTEGTHP